MAEKTRRIVGTLAAVSMPFPFYIGGVVALDWSHTAFNAAYGTVWDTVLSVASLILPIASAIIGFLFVLMAFGRRALWVALVYVPVMAIMVVTVWIGIIGAMFGRTPY